jgi:sulfatase maturation enzyme AslB (radical SAM superfamily)
MEEYFDKVMPRYTDVARTIEAFFQENEACFRNNLVNRRISIIDLPACQSELLIPFSGYGETRIVEDVDLSPEVNHLVPEARLQRKVFADNRDDKIKRAQCRSCDYHPFCNGIYRMYVERVGWDEFAPVVKR